MSSSSSLTATRLPRTVPRDPPPPSAMSYDAFKPRFPIDPFSQVLSTPTAREPWSLHPEKLPVLHLLQVERRVILVLGQPSLALLEPLFHSLHLASSLLIIASHRPPTVPPTAQPAVRVLRLSNPVIVESSGAPRLVAVLERAEQIARVWRQQSGERIQWLYEETADPDSFNTKLSAEKKRYSFTASFGSIANMGSKTSLVSPSLDRSASTRKQNRSSFSLTRSAFLPPSDPNQRPFDVILNYLPSDIPDKVVLKQAILVTTLTRPYFVAATDAMPPPTLRYRSESRLLDSKPLSPAATQRPTRRWSMIRKADGNAATQSTPTLSVTKSGSSPPSAAISGTRAHRSNSSIAALSASRVTSLLSLRRARIIHLLPTPPAKPSQTLAHTNYSETQARLIRSIEAFLLAYSSPIPAPADAQNGDEMERARPYIIPATALKDTLYISPASDDEAPSQCEWTLAELLLAGALEPSSKSQLSQIARGKQKDVSLEWNARRAWIGGVSDIVVQHGLMSKGVAPKTDFAASASQQAFPAGNHDSLGGADLEAQREKLRAYADSSLPPTPEGSISDLDSFLDNRQRSKESNAARPALLVADSSNSVGNIGLLTPPDSDGASFNSLEVCTSGSFSLDNAQSSREASSRPAITLTPSDSLQDIELERGETVRKLTAASKTAKDTIVPPKVAAPPRAAKRDDRGRRVLSTAPAPSAFSAPSSSASVSRPATGDAPSKSRQPSHRHRPLSSLVPTTLSGKFSRSKESVVQPPLPSETRTRTRREGSAQRSREGSRTRSAQPTAQPLDPVVTSRTPTAPAPKRSITKIWRALQTAIAT